MKTFAARSILWLILAQILALSQASSFGQLSVLSYFNGTNGAQPSGPLIQAKDGSLYGVTSQGGTNMLGPLGTVFKVTTNGILSSVVSFSFDATGFSQGYFPLGGLVQGQDGNFYGAAEVGGTYQWGTLFVCSPGGSLHSILSFNATNGLYPQGGLVQDSQGYLYGTTQLGGPEYASGTNVGHGTVFKVSTNGTFIWLVAFSGTNGEAPVGLVAAQDGNFYGTTSSGGTNSSGTIFRITPGGALTSLYSFSGDNDGNSPQAGLIQGKDGALYGTTQSGGQNGDGTVFRITTNGAFSVLYYFGQVIDNSSSEPLDGSEPTAALVQGTDGNFYGTTSKGGTNGFGTVFGLTPQGALTRYYSFGQIQDASGNPLDGANPSAALVQASDGRFYGTTPSGGPNDVSSGGDGAVFSFSNGGRFAPFIVLQPTNQNVLPGGTATLVAVAGGTSPLNYQWQLNGANLKDTARISGSLSNVLTITGMSTPDFGPYQVIVNNNYGSVTSVVATLAQAIPPGISQQPASITVNPGAGAFFTVSATGTPPLSFQWLRNGTNLSDSANISGATDSFLDVNPASAADAGTYSVVISSPFGSTNSVPVTLSIATLPDLVVSNVIVPPEAWTGSSFDVAWADSNPSRAGATGPWVDDLYLSPDTRTNDAVQFLGHFPFDGNLGPGQSINRLRTVTLNLTGITNGQYHVLVLVNADGSVLEGAPANNLGGSSNLLVHVTPLPGLKVSSVSGPTNGLGGQTVGVSWVVCNNGQADTDVPVWQDHLYLSKTNNLSGVIADFGPFENPSYLAVGDCYQQDVTVKLPVGISGPFYFVVNSDSEGLVGADTGSNVVGSSTQPINVQFVAPGYLHVSSVQVAPAPPTSVWSGDAVTVTWTVQNIGQTSITGTWDDEVTLSPTPVYDFVNGYWDVIDHIYFDGPLAPGQSYSHTNKFLVPKGITPGTWYAVPIVDTHFFAGGTGAIGSGSIGRDQKSTPVIVAPPIPSDLEVTSFSSRGTAFVGRPLKLSWVVSNNGLNGASSDNWYDGVYLSTDGTFDTNRNLLLGSFVHWGGLDLGASYTNEATVTIPAGVLPPNAPSVTNYLFVFADNGNAVVELTKTNNVLEGSSGLKVLPAPPVNPPYLVASGVTAPGTLLAGGPASVVWTVTNQGDAMAGTTNWTDALYLSASPQYSPGKGYLLGLLANHTNLDAGDAYSRSQSFTVPACLGGTYYLTAVADVSNAVDAACCQTNNFTTLATPIQIFPTLYPSLQVSTLTLPAGLTSSVPWTAQWTVSNAGSGPASGTWFDAVYASSLPALDTNAVLLGQFEHSGTLAAGAAYSQSQSVQLPACTSGNDYIFVVADVSNSVNVAMTCQLNNPARSANALPVSFGQYPNLMVRSISIPASASAELPMNVSWTVTNAGAATAVGSWIDSVYLSTNANSMANGILLGFAPQNRSLAPGAAYSQSVSLGLPNVTGPFYVFVVTDSTNGIQECFSHTNNATASTGTVDIEPTLYPDLKVTAVRVPATAFAGQPITLSWVVTNEGTAPTPSVTWRDTLYLSQDQVLNESATRLGGADNPGPLGVGQSYTNSATVTIPTDKTGAFYVLVLADSGGVLFQHLGFNDSLGWNANALQITLPPPAKLQPGNVTISPATGTAGTQATINWSVTNTTANGTVSSWTDGVYLSTNTVWDLTAILLANVDHTGLGPLDSYDASWTGPLPGLSPGAYHAIVRADVHNSVPETSLANLVAVSANTIALDVPILVLGQKVSGQLNTGDAQFYKVNCPAGQTVRITLTGSSNISANELYVRFGSVPDLGNYSFVYNNPMSPNQQIDIPSTQAGWYYIMVRGGNEPGGPLGYTLGADIVPFAISSVTPGHIGDNGQVTITVSGAKFQDGASVELVSGANRYAAGTNFFLDATTLKARFFLTNAVHGIYDVVLTNPGNQTAMATQAVTIETALPISAKIIPGLINSLPRVGLPFEWLGTVANDGNVDVPYLTVVILDLPNFPILLSPPLEAIASDNNDAFLARDLAPGSALDFSFEVSGFEDQPFYYNIVPVTDSKEQFLAKAADDAESIREFLSDPANGLTITVTNTSGIITTNPFWLPPFVAKALATTNDWENLFGQSLVAGHVIESNDLALLPLPTGTASPLVASKRIRPKEGGCEICETQESSQEKIDNASYGAEAVSCGGECAEFVETGAGAVLCYAACMTIPVIHHAIGTVVIKVTKIYCDVACFLGPDEPPPQPWKPVRPKRPKDPNEKQGPAGFSPAGLVGAQVPWQYTIYFENTSNAPAFARQVTISDVLDPNLDLRTFRVGNLAIGNITIATPTNSAHFQTRINLPSPNPTNVVADVSIGIDVQKRTLLWTMNAIDVNTGQLVTDTQQGVLPPNTTNNVGAGYVTFSIKPLAGLRTGTTITNQASIVFDTNDPLPTNPTTNTVDALAPTSAVAALPAAVNSDAFTVSWSGKDDSGGSGVGSYTIWYSDNGAPYQVWLANTNGTSALFQGQFGHSYAFYSSAQDNGGNVEAPHATADAATSVASLPVIAPIADRTINVGTALTLTNIVTDADQPPPTFTYSLGPNAPAGASISDNGILAWAPDCAQGSSTNLIQVIVTASGNPPQTNFTLFRVIVGDCVQVGLGSAVVQPGQSACVPVNLLSTVGLTNLSFTASFPANRFTNWSIAANNPAMGTSTAQALDASHVLFTVNARPGQVLQGPTLAGQICFSAAAGPSAFVPVQISSVAGLKADGTSVGNTSGVPGEVAVVSSAPLLQAGLSTTQGRVLTLYGSPGANYVVEWRTNLVQGTWSTGWNVTMTNLSETFLGVGPQGGTVFYRAR